MYGQPKRLRKREWENGNYIVTVTQEYNVTNHDTKEVQLYKLKQEFVINNYINTKVHCYITITLNKSTLSLIGGTLIQENIVTCNPNTSRQKINTWCFNSYSQI